MPSRNGLILKVFPPAPPEVEKVLPETIVLVLRFVTRRLFPKTENSVEFRVYISKGILVEVPSLTPEIPP